MRVFNLNYSPFSPRHSQNRSFGAFRCLRSYFLLINGRSAHASQNVLTHASMIRPFCEAWLNF